MTSVSAVTVTGLHRYPVKSMLGVALPTAHIDGRGLAGDRLWAVRTAEGKLGSGKTTRRFAALPGLLELRTRVGEDGGVVVVFPDGSAWSADDPATADRLSAHVGRPVTLAREGEVGHFDDGAVSLVGSASVAAVGRHLGRPVDPSRFRANVELGTDEPFTEQEWAGRRVRVGGAILEITAALTRCLMVDAATADLPEGGGVLRAVGAINGVRLGVHASVVTPGWVRVGDVVTVL